MAYSADANLGDRIRERIKKEVEAQKSQIAGPHSPDGVYGKTVRYAKGNHLKDIPVPNYVKVPRPKN